MFLLVLSCSVEAGEATRFAWDAHRPACVFFLGGNLALEFLDPALCFSVCVCVCVCVYGWFYLRASGVRFLAWGSGGAGVLAIKASSVCCCWSAP